MSSGPGTLSNRKTKRPVACAGLITLCGNNLPCFRLMVYFFALLQPVCYVAPGQPQYNICPLWVGNRAPQPKRSACRSTALSWLLGETCWPRRTGAHYRCWSCSALCPWSIFPSTGWLLLTLVTPLPRSMGSSIWTSALDNRQQISFAQHIPLPVNTILAVRRLYWTSVTYHQKNPYGHTYSLVISLPLELQWTESGFSQLFIGRGIS